MKGMRFVQFREGEEAEEVQSIRLAHEPGELVIELEKVQIVDWEEMVGKKLWISRHFIKFIIE